MCVCALGVLRAAIWADAVVVDGFEEGAAGGVRVGGWEDGVWLMTNLYMIIDIQDGTTTNYCDLVNYCVAPWRCFAQPHERRAQKVICGIPVKEFPEINFFGLLVRLCDSPEKMQKALEKAESDAKTSIREKKLCRT